MTDLVGKTLGPYKLEATLGRGGMAMVYRAYQSSVKRYVAIKVMAAEIADQPGFVERFEREAEVIASLEHPHILPVIDYGNTDGVHYLVMRYIEGGSLDERMRRKPLTLAECSRMLNQMASALDYAHSRGVIHRDLKPNNVLLDSTENAYLTDFGIARLAQSEHKLTATGSVMGTPAYMSPEQALGRPVDARADIYTLGVVLYEMVLNKLPYVGDTPAALIFQHVYEKPIDPRTVKPDLPESIALILNRAMAKNPDERYQSAMELSQAYNDAISGRASSIRTSGLEENMSTFVGGAEPPPNFGSVPQTTSAPSDQGQTYTPGTPGMGSVPPVPPQPSATNLGGTAATPGPSPATSAGMATASGGSRLSPVLIVAIVLVILAVIGGGAFFVSNMNVTNSNNTGTAVAANSTSTAVAGNSTGTAVAVLALSATATQTNTPVPTNTPTATATITRTPTATYTDTPNATLTAVAGQMSTLAAFQAGQTATNVAQIMATATYISGVAQTQAALSSATALANQGATATAVQNQTATAEAGQTATVVAGYSPTPTSTRHPTATRRPTATRSPNAVPYSGTAEDVIKQLRTDGQLSGPEGKVVLQSDNMTVTVDKAGFDRWNRPDTTVNVGDFVISSEITLTAPEAGNQCGFLLRYSAPPGDDANQSTFYTVTLGRSGTYQAYAREKSGYRNDAILEKPSKLIQTDDGATNYLLLIVQGSTFKIFINGQLADTFTDPAFKTGNVGALGSRPQASTGLTCKFHNFWTYALGATPQVNGNNGAGLLSNTPDDILNALVAANAVPDGGKLVVQDPPNQLNINDKDALMSRSEPLTRTILTNFAMSVDITSTGSADQTSTACGVYYNGKDIPNNWIVVFFTRHQTYSMFTRKGGSWAKSPVSTGEDTSIKSNSGDTNRFILTVINNKATLFVNGTKIFEAKESSFPNGVIGYYMEKAEGQSSETCSYNNTLIWRLP